MTTEHIKMPAQSNAYAVFAIQKTAKSIGG